MISPLPAFLFIHNLPLFPSTPGISSLPSSTAVFQMHSSSSGRLKVIPCSTHCFDPNTFFSGKFLFVLQLLVFLPDTVFVLLCLISFLYILTLAVLPICSPIILNCSHLFIAWSFSQTLSNLTAGYCKSFLSPKLKIPPSHIVDVQ